MKLFSLRFVGLLCITLIKVPTSFAVSLFSVEAISEMEPLAKNYGYLLIDLDVNGSAPSLEYARIMVENQNYLKPEQSLKYKGKEQVVDLKDKKQGFYLAKIPAGLFQIKRVNVPYYALPFRLSTEKKRDWRFSIEAGQVNYIGKLMINKERSTQYVEINLINRIATDKTKIEKVLDVLLKTYPLRLGSGVRDDFLQTYSGKAELSPSEAAGL